MKLYALFTYGFHFQDFLNHVLFKERQSDSREILIHHIATTSLFPGYLFGNLMGLGSLIAFLHDIADNFVCTSRFFNSIGWNKATTFFYIILMTTWLYTRVLILPFLLYNGIMRFRLPQNPDFLPFLACEMTFLTIL